MKKSRKNYRRDHSQEEQRRTCFELQRRTKKRIQTAEISVKITHGMSGSRNRGLEI